MLPLAGDIAARFEAGSDRSVGDGRAQHPVDCEGGKEGSLTTHRLSMCRIREVLRLRHQSLTERVIAQMLGVSNGVVHVTCGGRALRG